MANMVLILLLRLSMKINNWGCQTFNKSYSIPDL
jgi:hypothetical protein